MDGRIGREVRIGRRGVNIPIREGCGVKGGRWGRSGLRIRKGGAGMGERGIAPFLVRGGDWGRKTFLPIRGGIKMVDIGRGLRGFPLKRERGRYLTSETEQ